MYVSTIVGAFLNIMEQNGFRYTPQGYKLIDEPETGGVVMTDHMNHSDDHGHDEHGENHDHHDHT